MNIIGIHQSGLNSAAALVRDGEVTAALLEERLTRQKHFKYYPAGAVEECLRISGVGLGEIDLFGVAWNPMIQLASRYRAGFSEWVPYGGQRLYSAIHPMAAQMMNDNSSSATITVDGQKIRYAFVKHHLCHAASGFFLSPFSSAAYITCDGYGETQTLTWGMGENNEITEMGSLQFPNSIGAFYSVFTQYLGFRADKDEWKLMGASGYGDPGRFYSRLRRLIDFTDGGQLELDLTYFDYFNFETGGLHTQKLEKYLEIPPLPQRSHLTQIHMDLAAAVQKVTEEILMKVVRHVMKHTNASNLCLSGGTFLNSKFNGLIRDAVPECKNLFIPFCPDDAGNSIGAALYLAASEDPHVICKEADPFLGPNWTPEEIKTKLDDYRISGDFLEHPEKDAAQAICDGKVVGWFQGRMEFGPRALGNRCILADPRHAGMKDLLNKTIKFREPFRPFAPAVLQEHAGTWFEMPTDESIPFMEKIYPFLETKKGAVPAVVHADGTGRLQTVEQRPDSLFRELIMEFYHLTGVPMVLNTSFNLNGEPIVCSPEDALRTFFTSGVDVLYLEGFRISK